MQRYDVTRFDRNTFVVFDKRTNREVCVCGNYESGMDAAKRADTIAAALNAQSGQRSLVISRPEKGDKGH